MSRRGHFRLLNRELLKPVNCAMLDSIVSFFAEAEMTENYRLIPPPPTKFGPTPAQPKLALPAQSSISKADGGLKNSAVAPPPIRWPGVTGGSAQRSPSGPATIPPPAVHWPGAFIQRASFRRGFIQRMLEGEADENVRSDVKRRGRTPRVTTGVSPVFTVSYVPENYTVEGIFAHWGGSSATVQGWKMHVTSDPSEISDIAELVLPELQKLGIKHKIVISKQEFVKQRGTQVGKLITIFPKDDDEARIVIEALGELLKGKTSKIEVGHEIVVAPLTSARFGLHHPWRLGVDIKEEELERDGWEIKSARVDGVPFLQSPLKVTVTKICMRGAERLYVIKELQGFRNVLCVAAKRGVFVDGVAAALLAPDRKHWVADDRTVPDPFGLTSDPAKQSTGRPSISSHRPSGEKGV